MKIERKDDPKTMVHVITITLTREEIVRAKDEMTQAEREAVYLMSQSPLFSTQICTLFELVSALERADAKAAMGPDALMDEDDSLDDL